LEHPVPKFEGTGVKKTPSEVNVRVVLTELHLKMPKLILFDQLFTSLKIQLLTVLFLFNIFKNKITELISIPEMFVNLRDFINFTITCPS